MSKTKTADAADDVAAPKKSKKKLIIAVLVVLLAAGASYWFVLKPSPGAAAPVAGEVVPLDPIQINLADGHYLSIGIALQLTDAAKEADGSKALDAAIEMFSGRSTEELATRESREELKKELLHKLEKAYDEEVMDVYFTQFVTQ